jgi:primosomal protein N' (replication factor Y)
VTDPGAGPLFVSVAVPVPTRRLFAYRVDPPLRGAVRVGVRVRVPFAARRIVGTVVECPAAAPEDGVEARAVESVLTDAASPEPAILALTRFVSDYYLCSWGEAIETALPPEAGPPPGQRAVVRLPGVVPEQVPATRPAQRRTLASLPSDGTPVALASLGESRRRAVAGLAAAGLVRVVERRVMPRTAAQPGAPEAGPAPTAAQSAVLDRLVPAVRRRGYAPHLLFGATGSGKTEVYLRAAEAAIDAGRGALYLVPEIGLTPLLVSRIERRFPGKIAVLHSGLGARERRDAWERVRSGDARFAVGARSAVFAPVRDLGLIVIDEEQDGSYKQHDSPRYNARDLAVVRAREEGATLVLGSATPSLESFHHARSGRYALLSLGGRVEERPLAHVRVVDMRVEYQRTRRTAPLSGALIEALRAALSRGQQALVLRNRRGWAVAILCPACGTRANCPRCSVAMTWHEAERRLRCHYCLFETSRPKLCATCGGTDLRDVGEGSERIEHELRGALPAARIARMDRDTVRRRGAHEALLRRFDAGEIDVLVGTQMIAKGHDFPKVTVVGVLSADQTLGLPDFRAGERAFQLLTQVAGRAGRGEAEGTVIVQAFDPGHPVLAEAARQDFVAFYEREIQYRRALRYPPLTALVALLVMDRSEARAAEWAEVLAEALGVAGEGRLLLAGPGPAPLERIKGLHRQQILVRSAGRRRLVSAVDRALEAVEGKIPRRAIQVDVDPLSLL